MNRLCFLLILGILLLLGCDRDSDDGSTAFVDNDLNDGSPVVGIPAPTPFVPPGSPAVLTIPASDLVGTGGTVHVFTVSLLNITGNGSLSATTMIAAASGSLSGFPVSISFSSVIEIAPGSFSSTGTFSGALTGTGTVNTQIIYTEEDRTTAGVFTFSFSGGPPPGTEICTNGVDDDGDTLVDCGDPDCTADPSCAGPACGVVGETCDDALCVTSAATEAFDTSLATSEGTTSSCAGGGATTPDLWYIYTPPTSGTATFSLCAGTAYDSAMAIYSDCPAVTELDCDDDFCAAFGPSETTATVTAGTPVFIRIYGFGGGTGAGVLTVTDP